MRLPFFAILLLSFAGPPAPAWAAGTPAAEPAPGAATSGTGAGTAPCPMQIDVSLGSTPGRRAFSDLPQGTGWVSTGMSRYACDTERVRMLFLRDVTSSEETVELDFRLTVESERLRQDVDLIVSLVDAAGREFCRTSKAGLTVGKDVAVRDDAWIRVAAGTQRPRFRCELTPGEYESLFEADAPPRVRIILVPDLQDEEETELVAGRVRSR